MKICETCAIPFDDTEGVQCPGCTTKCADCGAMYNATQLTMCPECRLSLRGEVEFPCWLQDDFAAHNRRVRRNWWFLGLGVAVVLIFWLLA